MERWDRERPDMEALEKLDEAGRIISGLVRRTPPSRAHTELVDLLSRFAIPDGINAVGMHRITWPQMGPFIRHAVGAMLDAAAYRPTGAPFLLQEEPVPYRTASQPVWSDRIAA